jgi:hypothetical protein
MRPVVMVSGLGRCGSSLAMQMLAAGGLPCVGRFPAYEDGRVLAPRLDADWLRTLGGHAVKVIDPHLHAWPREVPRVVVWCDRDPVEQARSQAKFLSILAGATVDRSTVRALASSCRRDRASNLRSFQRAPLLVLRFEDVIARPRREAVRLNQFLGGGLDPDAMTAAVRPRGAACAPGLALEAELIAGSP